MCTADPLTSANEACLREKRPSERRGNVMKLDINVLKDIFILDII
jgi:hypothetical protein